MCKFIKNYIEKKREKKKLYEHNVWLNNISREEFLEYSIFSGDYLFKLKHLYKLSGYGNDIADYMFYDSMDYEDKEGLDPFEGLRVSENGDGNKSIVVSYERLLELMEKYKVPFIEKNPDKKEEVEKYIEEYKKNAHLN